MSVQYNSIYCVYICIDEITSICMVNANDRFEVNNHYFNNNQPWHGIKKLEHG